MSTHSFSSVGPGAVPSPYRILFVSTGNSCRSQIAEGWARTLAPGHVVVRSAGTRPRHLHPLAAWVMQESGVDIGAQRGKSIGPFRKERFHLVVTLCETAAAECGELPLAVRCIHRPFDDPALLESDGDEDVDSYRALRDEIRAFVEDVLREV